MLPIAVGQRVIRVLTGALSGGLLVGAVTGTLYGWGRGGYYPKYLAAYNLKASAANPPVPDVLFAPLNTLFATWARAGLAIVVLGVLGMGVVAARMTARHVGAYLRGVRQSQLQRLIRGRSTRGHRAPTSEQANGDERPTPEQQASDDEQFEAAARTAFAGFLFLLGALAVVGGGFAASHDGEKEGGRDFDACKKGSAGILVDEAGRKIGNFCGRIGDDLITYNTDRGAAQVEKYDKQRIIGAPPPPPK